MLTNWLCSTKIRGLCSSDLTSSFRVPSLFVLFISFTAGGKKHYSKWEKSTRIAMVECNDSKRQTNNVTTHGTDSASSANLLKCEIIRGAVSSSNSQSSTVRIPVIEDVTHWATNEQIPSFAQLAVSVGNFPPLQEMICAVSTTINCGQQQRITARHEQGEFLEPIALRRHVHSTPLLRQSELSVRKDDEYVCDSDEDEPPPVGLEILNHARSRSTPLSTSKNSAFGTILRTNSQKMNDESLPSSSSTLCKGGSAFSLSPYSMLNNDNETRSVVFNPIQNKSEILTTTDCDAEQGEMTSIEVTSVTFSSEQEIPQQHTTKKMNAASRAAKFLTDVRNLRISGGINGGATKTGSRDGRKNPARRPFISSDDSTKNGSRLSTTAITNSSFLSSNLNVRRDTILCDNSSETSSFPASNSSSSGQSTNATVNSMCNSSNAHSHATQLSAISETDLEVANVNHQQRDQTHVLKSDDKASHDQIELSLRTDRITRKVGGCNGSIDSISPSSRARLDGASVRADQFFAYQQNSSNLDKRFRKLPPFSRKVESTQSSPSAGSVASLNTNSTGSSNEPPKIVSYIDRKVSDLTSYRTVDRELRDSSPVTLPPRMTTPPSSDSSVNNAISPPRQITGLDNAGTPSTTFLPSSDEGSNEIVRLYPDFQAESDSNRSDYCYYNLTPSSPVYGQQVTCAENSIEILKIDQPKEKDDQNSRLVTPDKGWAPS